MIIYSSEFIIIAGAIGQGYFCTTRFSETIVNFLPMLVPLTRILWQQTKAKMLPTPAKFHYVFNLRDLSRIWEGLLRIERAECESITTLLKLWEHECTRVIADRFVIFFKLIFLNILKMFLLNYHGAMMNFYFLFF